MGKTVMMPVMKRILAGGLFVAVAALLTSCSLASDARPTDTADESRASEGEIATYELPQNWGSDAGEGRGVLVEIDGCVRLDNSRVPVFPSDQVTWDGETLTFGADQYRIGDTITFAGNEIGDRSELEAAIPSGCSTGPFWIVGPLRD